MILAAAFLWFYLVSDLTAGDRMSSRSPGYETQALCEAQAEFVSQTSRSLIVHLRSQRPVRVVLGQLKSGKDVTVDGWYQNACFRDAANTPTVSWWFTSATMGRAQDHTNFPDEATCRETMLWLASDPRFRVRGCWPVVGNLPAMGPTPAPSLSLDSASR